MKYLIIFKLNKYFISILLILFHIIKNKIIFLKFNKLIYKFHIILMIYIKFNILLS